MGITLKDLVQIFEQNERYFYGGGKHRERPWNFDLHREGHSIEEIDEISRFQVIAFFFKKTS